MSSAERVGIADASYGSQGRMRLFVSIHTDRVAFRHKSAVLTLSLQGVIILERRIAAAAAIGHELARPEWSAGKTIHRIVTRGRSQRVSARSADVAEASAFDPLTSALVMAGVPVVIAMQFRVSDIAAIAFAARLYSDLGRGRSIDRGVGRLRAAPSQGHEPRPVRLYVVLVDLSESFGCAVWFNDWIPARDSGSAAGAKLLRLKAPQWKGAHVTEGTDILKVFAASSPIESSEHALNSLLNPKDTAVTRDIEEDEA